MVDQATVDAATLDAKLPVEDLYVTADFTNLVPAGATLDTVTCDVTVFRGGPDANPNAIKSGGATRLGFVASQKVQDGIPGTMYLLTFQGTLSDTQTPVVQVILPVVAIRLG